MSFMLDGAGCHPATPKASHGETMSGHSRGPLEPSGQHKTPRKDIKVRYNHSSQEHHPATLRKVGKLAPWVLNTLEITTLWPAPRHTPTPHHLRMPKASGFSVCITPGPGQILQCRNCIEEQGLWLATWPPPGWLHWPPASSKDLLGAGISQH